VDLPEVSLGSQFVSACHMRFPLESEQGPILTQTWVVIRNLNGTQPFT